MLFFYMCLPFGVESYFLLIIAINNPLFVSLISSRSGEFSNSLGIPLPTPTIGKIYLAFENSIGFFGIDIPAYIFSIVNVLVNFLGSN